jgi:hypothetical protein
MRANPQAVSARLLAVVPSRRLSSWSAPAQSPRIAPEGRSHVGPMERISMIERREAEERAARRSGRYVAEAAYLGRRW